MLWIGGRGTPAHNLPALLLPLTATPGIPTRGNRKWRRAPPATHQLSTGEDDVHLMQHNVQEDPLLLESDPGVQEGFSGEGRQGQ